MDELEAVITVCLAPTAPSVAEKFELIKGIKGNNDENIQIAQMEAGAVLVVQPSKSAGRHGCKILIKHGHVGKLKTSVTLVEKMMSKVRGKYVDYVKTVPNKAPGVAGKTEDISFNLHQIRCKICKYATNTWEKLSRHTEKKEHEQLRQRLSESKGKEIASKPSSGKKSVTVAVAKKMIRDRISEILRWQMQPAQVESLQGEVNSAGEAEMEQEALPFNLDNFCTLCKSRESTVDLLIKHYDSPKHKKIYLQKQLELGLEKFTEKYNMVPLAGVDTDGGKKLAVNVMSGHFQLPIDVFDKFAKWDLYKNMVVLCGVLNKFECKVCGDEYKRLDFWIQHVTETEHSKKCILQLLKKGKNKFKSEFKQIPVPVTNRVDDVLTSDSWKECEDLLSNYYNITDGYVVQQKRLDEEQARKVEMEARAAADRAQMLQDVDENALKTMDWRRLQVCRKSLKDLCQRTADECWFAHVKQHNKIDWESKTCWVCVDIVQTGRCLRQTSDKPCPFYHPSEKQVRILRQKQVYAPPEATSNPVPENTMISTSRKGRSRVPLGQLRSSFLPEGYEGPPPGEDSGGEGVVPRGEGGAPAEERQRQFNYSMQKIFIRGFPPDTSNDELKDLFDYFGPVTEVFLVHDKGYAFITFAESGTADMIINEMGGDIVMKGHLLRVDSVFRRSEPFFVPRIPSYIWPQMAFMPISDPTAAAAALVQATVAAGIVLESNTIGTATSATVNMQQQAAMKAAGHSSGNPVPNHVIPPQGQGHDPVGQGHPEGSEGPKPGIQRGDGSDVKHMAGDQSNQKSRDNEDKPEMLSVTSSDDKEKSGESEEGQTKKLPPWLAKRKQRKAEAAAKQLQEENKNGTEVQGKKSVENSKTRLEKIPKCDSKEESGDKVVVKSEVDGGDLGSKQTKVDTKVKTENNESKMEESTAVEKPKVNNDNEKHIDTSAEEDVDVVSLSPKSDPVDPGAKSAEEQQKDIEVSECANQKEVLMENIKDKSDQTEEQIRNSDAGESKDDSAMTTDKMDSDEISGKQRVQSKGDETKNGEVTTDAISVAAPGTTDDNNAHLDAVLSDGPEKSENGVILDTDAEIKAVVAKVMNVLLEVVEVNVECDSVEEEEQEETLDSKVQEIVLETTTADTITLNTANVQNTESAEDNGQLQPEIAIGHQVLSEKSTSQEENASGHEEVAHSQNIPTPVVTTVPDVAPQPKITYKSGPVRYTYAEQQQQQQQQEQSSSEEQKPKAEEQAQTDVEMKHDLVQQQPDEIQGVHPPQHPQVENGALHHQGEPVYSTPQNYEETRMQMILAATLAQLPPDMTIGDLYQYINPNILDSMALPPEPVGVSQEGRVQEGEEEGEEEEEEHRHKYEEVIAQRAERRLLREQRRAMEAEIAPLLDGQGVEEGPPGDPARNRGRRRGGCLGHTASFDPERGGYVPRQRMDTTYVAGAGEFIGPELPGHMKHLAMPNDDFDVMAPDHDDVIDDIDDDDVDEYAAGFEEGEVVDGDHWAHPSYEHRRRAERARGRPRDDPLGFEDGDVISNDISDFHHRLLRMSGSVENQGHGHSRGHSAPAFHTGLQYSETGDRRPPYVRNMPGRYQEDISPHDWVHPHPHHHPPPPEEPSIQDPSRDPTGKNVSEKVMEFIRPKYHEEGYSERFHTAPTGGKDMMKISVVDEWELYKLEEMGKLTAAQRRYYREQIAMSQWGQAYRERDYVPRDKNKDRDFEVLERERQQRKEERRRLRREIEEQEARRLSKGWGSEWEREEARYNRRDIDDYDGGVPGHAGDVHLWDGGEGWSGWRNNYWRDDYKSREEPEDDPEREEDRRQRMREVRVYQRKEHERWMRDVMGLKRDFRPVRNPDEDKRDDRSERDRERGPEREDERYRSRDRERGSNIYRDSRRRSGPRYHPARCEDEETDKKGGDDFASLLNKYCQDRNINAKVRDSEPREDYKYTLEDRISRRESHDKRSEHERSDSREDYMRGHDDHRRESHKDYRYTQQDEEVDPEFDARNYREMYQRGATDAQDQKHPPVVDPTQEKRRNQPIYEERELDELAFSRRSNNRNKSAEADKRLDGFTVTSYAQKSKTASGSRASESLEKERDLGEDGFGGYSKTYMRKKYGEGTKRVEFTDRTKPSDWVIEKRDGRTYFTRKRTESVGSGSEGPDRENSKGDRGRPFTGIRYDDNRGARHGEGNKAAEGLRSYTIVRGEKVYSREMPAQYRDDFEEQDSGGTRKRRRNNSESEDVEAWTLETGDGRTYHTRSDNPRDFTSPYKSRGGASKNRSRDYKGQAFDTWGCQQNRRSRSGSIERFIIDFYDSRKKRKSSTESRDPEAVQDSGDVESARKRPKFVGGMYSDGYDGKRDTYKYAARVVTERDYGEFDARKYAVDRTGANTTSQNTEPKRHKVSSSVTVKKSDVQSGEFDARKYTVDRTSANTTAPNTEPKRPKVSSSVTVRKSDVQSGEFDARKYTVDRTGANTTAPNTEPKIHKVSSTVTVRKSDVQSGEPKRAVILTSQSSEPKRQKVNSTVSVKKKPSISSTVQVASSASSSSTVQTDSSKTNISVKPSSKSKEKKRSNPYSVSDPKITKDVKKLKKSHTSKKEEKVKKS